MIPFDFPHNNPLQGYKLHVGRDKKEAGKDVQ